MLASDDRRDLYTDSVRRAQLFLVGGVHTLVQGFGKSIHESSIVIREKFGFAKIFVSFAILP